MRGIELGCGDEDLSEQRGRLAKKRDQQEPGKMRAIKSKASVDQFTCAERAQIDWIGVLRLGKGWGRLCRGGGNLGHVILMRVVPRLSRISSRPSCMP